MLKGGIADKLGNKYEGLWTLLEALRVLRGQADEIRIEPFNEDAAGLEFRVTAQGRNTWHQCKRRLRSGTWTISALESAGILSDFMRKLADAASDCVFVSSDPAPDLRTLAGKATLVDSASNFLDSLGKDDELNLHRLARAWPVDPETLFEWLRRVRVETVSETSLARELTGLCSLLFTGDPAMAVERLAGFLDETVTHVITTERFRTAVEARGLGWQARFDETLKEKLAAATDTYLSSLGQPIAGVEIQTSELTEAVAAALDGRVPVTIVSGSAGSGKSLALSRIVSAARQRGWPVLGFRIDWFLDVRAITDVGTSLVGREENPVGVLGNQAANVDALLVIDQVDAVSEASGRSGRIRELVFQMIDAASYFRRLRVVLACRSYDLDNDSRLKALEKDAKAVAIRMKPLDWTTAVQPVLERLGLSTRRFSDRQREVLSIPINLQLFASLASAGEAVADDLTGAQLFDRLLELRERELRSVGIAWSAHRALTSLANWMSNNQVLTAPTTVLAAFPGAADVLSSHGLVTKAAGRIQFAHESFFDQTFSADFVARGGSVLALLKSDQQRLFRRTQVRQIFARLRDLGHRNYSANLREVMASAEVRYLVKDAVAAWLASVDQPLPAELRIVESWWELGQPYERLASTVTGGRGWLPVLIRSGAIGRLMGAGGARSSLAFWVLRNGAVEHARLVADYLRKWWDGDRARTSELLAWFDRLHPDGPIGELEQLYGDVIAAAPTDSLKLRFEEQFELGAWIHKKQYDLGARVVGRWLTRWMTAFPDSHPFGRADGSNGRYWIKELADQAPTVFLDAVWPAFVEGLGRERLGLASSRLSYPTIRLDGEDDAWIVLVGEALAKVASESPARAEAHLDTLPFESAPSLWLHLRAIAANGAHLARRLPSLLDSPDLFHLGERGGEWRPFAEAARAAMPFLPDPERRRVEERVMGHRPEYEQARQVLGWAREEGKTLGSDDRAYACRLLGRTGEVERAVLRTIGVDKLGPLASSRLSELERKFSGQPLPEADGARGGYVRSPIPPEKASLMTDAQWLRAIRRYTGNERHIYERDGVVGGAEQLAHVLQTQVKEQPLRFIQLLERLPIDTNPAYPSAVLRGLRESKPEEGATAIGLRGFRAASRWGRDRFRREICWLVVHFPEMGRDPDVLNELLAIATFGDASDTAVRTSPSREKTHVRDLLHGSDDLETSGINGDRGVAWEALAAVLWIEPTALGPVAELLERTEEELTSVRMCMLHAINAVLKHDAQRGLALLKQHATRDLVAVHSTRGHHVLRWASYNHTAEMQLVLDRLTGSNDDTLRALGLAMEAGLALHDQARESSFSSAFPDDVLRRRVAAFVAAGNLTADTVGARAARWLHRLFDDPETTVRTEAANVDWSDVLDGQDDRVELAKAFLQSRAFMDEPDRLVRAIEDRIDRFPTLTFDVVARVLEVQEQWSAGGRQRHSLAVHNLGRLLVGLYRAAEGDNVSEDHILDLFDTYLASELRDLGEEIRAYERH